MLLLMLTQTEHSNQVCEQTSTRDLRSGLSEAVLEFVTGSVISLESFSQS